MKKTLQQIAARAASWRSDMLIVAGAGSLAYGAWLVYEPAGFLVGGALVLVAGVLAALHEARKGA